MKCQYRWYSLPPGIRLTWKDRLLRRRLYDKFVEQQCHKDATHHTELGHALEFDMTEVCDEHLKMTLMEEDIKKLFKA